MSVQDDLLNENNNVISDEFKEVAPECNEGCSFWNSEPENEYSFLQNRACGDGLLSTKGKYSQSIDSLIEILEFAHLQGFLSLPGNRILEEKKRFPMRFKSCSYGTGMSGYKKISFIYLIISLNKPSTTSLLKVERPLVFSIFDVKVGGLLFA